MTTNYKTFAVFGLLAALLLCLPASAQLVSLTSTTTTAAMTAADRIVCLTSATGVNVPGVGTLGSALYIGSELMRVQSVTSASALCFDVRRSNRPVGHASGETVYIGKPNDFRTYDQAGTCTTGGMEVRPWINTVNGNIWDCVSSKYQVINGPAAYAVGVTALGPGTAGAVSMGSALLPFYKLYLGTAATNNFVFTPASTAAARVITIPDPLGAATIAFTNPAAGLGQMFTNTSLTSPSITTDIRATTAGSDTIGTASKPFGTLYLGTAATNNFVFTPAATAAARVITLADPGGAATVAYTNPTSQQTLTNTTLSGTGIVVGDTAKATVQFDATSGTTGTTLTDVTGMSVTVAPGTYRFYVNLPGVATSNSGIKAGFKYTTTVVTSIESTARIFTASAVAVQHSTSNADQATLAGSTSAAISTVIEGTMVVGTGGTIKLQAAQNASHGDTTSVYIGASMTFTRIL